VGKKDGYFLDFYFKSKRQMQNLMTKNRCQSNLSVIGSHNALKNIIFRLLSSI